MNKKTFVGLGTSILLAFYMCAATVTNRVLSGFQDLGDGHALVEKDRMTALQRLALHALLKKKKLGDTSDTKASIASIEDLAPLMDDCRKNPAHYSKRFVNWVSFVDLVAPLKDTRQKLMLVKGYICTTTRYNDEKSKNKSEYFKNHNGKWEQNPLETINLGTGVCADYTIEEMATLRYVMGKAFFENKVSYLAHWIGEKDHGLTMLQKDVPSHAVAAVTYDDGQRGAKRYLMNNNFFEDKNWAEASVSKDRAVAFFAALSVLEEERAYLLYDPADEKAEWKQLWLEIKGNGEVVDYVERLSNNLFAPLSKDKSYLVIPNKRAVHSEPIDPRYPYKPELTGTPDEQFRKYVLFDSLSQEDKERILKAVDLALQLCEPYQQALKDAATTKAATATSKATKPDKPGKKAAAAAAAQPGRGS